MSVRGLKTKIAINFAILLFLAMLLIDLVMMVAFRRELIRSEALRADIILAYLQDSLRYPTSKDSVTSNFKLELILTKMIDDSQIASALVLGRTGEKVYLGQQSDALQNQLVGFTNQAISAAKKTIHFMGTVWGIFWNQKAKLTLSAPLLKNGETVGGISIVLTLDRVYNTLRNSQQILFIYIFINLVILTFVGIYRISKIYLKPLARLAKRAEDYKEDDGIIFAVRKEDNELSRLSKALNSMLRRISADKQKLRSTVLSLEKANIELKKAQKEIIRAEKLASVGRLSAGIAHEIGNPIGIVIGYLELLKQKDVSENERNEYICRTEKEIERINTIIRQLLEISRPSNSGRCAVSVHSVIHDTADVLRVQPLMSNVELSLSLRAEDDTVLADSNQLRQVFLNLMINAADAISSPVGETCGQIKIITELANNPDDDTTNGSARLKIIFMDDGPGIAEENIGDIFDPFFTTKEPGKGTGLGLSVSFMIVESMGGKITVTSEAGRGTTMIIYLPLYDTEQPQ